MTADAQNTDSPTPNQQRRPSLLDRTSLLFRLGLMTGVFVAGIVALISITHQARQHQSAATDGLARLADAQRYAENVGRASDDLRGDLYAAVYAPRGSGGARQALQTWQAEVRKLRDELDQGARPPLSPPLEKAVNATRARADEILLRSEDLVKAAARDNKTVLPLLPAFEQRVADHGETVDGLSLIHISEPTRRS